MSPLEAATTTTTSLSFPTLLLSAIVWVPSLGAIALLFFPGRTDLQRERIRAFVLWVTAITAGLGVIMWYGFRDQSGTYAYEETRAALGALSASYHLGVDGVSMPLLLLSTVLFLFAAMGSSRIREQANQYFILLLVLETGVNGVFASLDYLLFFVFWLMQAIPMFLLIGRFGGPRRAGAAWKLLGLELASSGLLLMAILILYFTAKTHTFDIATLHDVAVPASSALLVTWLFFIAFAAKLPIFPLHVAFLDAQAEAPPGVALVLGGAVVKLAGYGLIRINVGEFQGSFHKIIGAVMVILVVSVLWSAIASLAQDDLRRVVGYVVMSQMGVIAIAIASASPVAINGAIMMLVATGLSSALLVLVAAAIIERANTVSIRAMGGMAARMTRGAAMAFLSALAVAGVPGLATFTGLVLMILGAYGSHRIAVPLALVGVFVVAVVLIWAVQRVFFGPPQEAYARIRDLGTMELVNTVGLLSLLVLIGVLPALLMDSINFSVITLLSGSGA